MSMYFLKNSSIYRFIENTNLEFLHFKRIPITANIIENMESIIEWEKSVRQMNATLFISLPREWVKRWHIERGSELIISLMPDGTISLRQSDRELEFQKRLKEIEKVTE